MLDVPTPEQLFKDISDLDLPFEGPELLEQVMQA